MAESWSSSQEMNPSRFPQSLNHCVHQLCLLAGARSRVIVFRCDATDRFRFLMLRPSVHFRSVLEEARAVVLLGGTMQPFGHFTTQLFRDLPPENLREFACDHVVDPENVLAISLCRGPSNKPLNFSFRH